MTVIIHDEKWLHSSPIRLGEPPPDSRLNRAVGADFDSPLESKYSTDCASLWKRKWTDQSAGNFMYIEPSVCDRTANSDQLEWGLEGA